MSSSSTISQQLRLSELTALIADAVNDPFRNRTFWVVAEVTDHSHKSDKNYHYFSLVEKHPDSHQLVAKLSATAWGAGSNAIKSFQLVTGQRFTNNIQILAGVSVQYHPVYGLQLVLQDIDPVYTLGALAQQRQATLDLLVLSNPEFISKVGDTYITRNRQLSLNPVIQHIAVICSATSAGWQDFHHTLFNNPHGYQFEPDPYFTTVQGEASTQAVVDRLIDIFKSNKPYDAVVIVRGGGAQTDFMIFDHYVIGKAIAKFPIPVITGIGHQKNETIADLMAHHATKTPTQAAEFIISRNRSFEEAVLSMQQQLIIRTQKLFNASTQLLNQARSTIVNHTYSQISTHKDELVQTNQTVVNRSRQLLTENKDGLNNAHQIVVNKTKAILFEKNRHLINLTTSLTSKPKITVAHRSQELASISGSMKAILPIIIKNQRGYLGHLATMINALSPDNTLKRGFAIVKVDNTVTSDPNKIVPGKDIEIILSKQAITATVTTKKDYNGTDFNI